MSIFLSITHTYALHVRALQPALPVVRTQTQCSTHAQTTKNAQCLYTFICTCCGCMNVRGRLSGSGVLQQALSMRQFKHLRASGSNFAMTLKAVYAHESCALASGQHVCIYVCECMLASICVSQSAHSCCLTGSTNAESLSAVCLCVCFGMDYNLKHSNRWVRLQLELILDTQSA